MFRKFSSIVALVLLTVYGCSTFYYQPPLAKFNHENHVTALFEQQKDCTFCHKLPAIEALIERGLLSDNTAAELKTILKSEHKPELKIDTKCHSCHKDRATKVAKAPQQCGACHETMKTMKPGDHVKNWTRMHAVPAGLDKKGCQNCHKQWYCETCHSQQYSMERRMHSRTFRLRHSMEALVDPGSCSSCHRVDFCIECHLEE